MKDFKDHISDKPDDSYFNDSKQLEKDSPVVGPASCYYQVIRISGHQDIRLKMDAAPNLLAPFNPIPLIP